MRNFATARVNMNGKKFRYYLSAVPAPYLLRQLFGRARKLMFHRHPPGNELPDITNVPDHIHCQWTRLDWSNPAVYLCSEGLADYLAMRYLAHEFDNLGTGWVSASYDYEAAGIGDHSYQMNLRLPNDLRDGQWLQAVVAPGHLEQSIRTWGLLMRLDPGYQPIDWQKDRKSGFRWSAMESHTVQTGKSRDVPGVDLNQAWELARFLHLPQMALLALHSPPRCSHILREFQCQVLDFAATNSTGMGVNWSCTMDVAIRAANLVIAYWFIDSQSVQDELTLEFRQAFTRLVHQHGRFIRHNLEYNAGNTGNHYLANLVGLLFTATFLPESSVTDEWERYAVNELLREVDRQFYPDGGHFEGSTCYHALCTELLVFGAALACDNRSGIPLPDYLFQRINAALDLLGHLQTPAGNLVQFGDNDSGRLFRLVPRGKFLSTAQAKRTYENLAHYRGDADQPYFDEDLLDYRSILDIRSPGSLEYQLLNVLSSGAFYSRLERVPFTPVPEAGSPVKRARHSLLYSASREFKSKGNLRKNLRMWHYPEFGAHIVESENLYLAISVHSNSRQKRNLPHNHNDKLAVELHIDGQAILTDPGSYVYTPLRAWRDRFRSVAAHNTLQVNGVEQNRFVDSFISYRDVRCGLLRCSETSLVFSLTYRGVRQLRAIEINENSVVVSDSCNRPFTQCWNDFPWESPGYGKLCRRV